MSRLVRMLLAVACFSVAVCATCSKLFAADLADRIRKASKLIAENPRSAKGYLARAALYSAADDHKNAIADYDEVIKLDPASAEVYDLRGSEQFMRGRINESIDDFNRCLKLRPQQEAGHWKRGISFYYAGRYEEGRRQFEGYEQVDNNDVENAVWRYLCMARQVGVDEARRSMLKIKQDRRVPMMQIYDLYCGNATADDVMAAVKLGNPPPDADSARLFYAHLYLGLYYEVNEQPELAQRHISTAAEKHRIGHYMWNVADVHAKLLQQQGAKNAAAPGSPK